jgi:hypothetical protein
MSRLKYVTKWRPVDRVAMVLACGLGLLGNLILVVTMVQIIDHQSPELTLSENATQIIITIAGGITGLLGAYVGVNRGRRRLGGNGEDDSHEDEQP